jgi:hypothetical protein
MKCDEQSTGRVARADHWVYLDRWWAQRLGIKKTAGVYRIRSRELTRRLFRERLGVDAVGTVFAFGSGAPVDSIERQRWSQPARETAVPQHRGRYRY